MVNGPLKKIRAAMPLKRPLFFNETAVTATNERSQAEHVVKKVSLALTSGGVGYVWFKLAGKRYNWGLLTDDFEPRPAYAAYGTMVDMFSSRKPSGMINLGKDNFCYTFSNDDSKLLVYWSQTNDSVRGLWTLKGISPDTKVEKIAITGRRKGASKLMGRALIEISEEPEYLLINDKVNVSLDKPVVMVKGPIVVYPDNPVEAKVNVNNPFSEVITLRLSQNGITKTVSLKPGEGKVVGVPVSMPKGEKINYSESLNVNLKIAIDGQPGEYSIKAPAVAGAWIPKGSMRRRDADFVITGRPQIQNLFDFDPGSSGYVHTGVRDLSAKAWLEYDKKLKSINFRIEVRDDIHKPESDRKKVLKGDAVMFTLHLPENKGYWKLVLADNPGKPHPQMIVYKRPKGGSPNPCIYSNFKRKEGVTVYNYRFSLEKLGLTPDDLKNGIGFNFVFTDKDLDQLEGWGELVPGLFKRTRKKGNLAIVRFE